MELNEWLAERYTPMDVLALGAVASATLVGTLALAQSIEIVPGTEPIGLLLGGMLFIAVFGAAIAYMNKKNREVFYGTSLDIRFDHENGQVVLDESVAIKILAYPDGFLSDPVTSFEYENLGDNAEGWFVPDENDPEEDDLYMEITLESPA